MNATWIIHSVAVCQDKSPHQELVAENPDIDSWEEVAEEMAGIFQGDSGEEYLQPGSLPAMLRKTINSTGQQNDTD